MLFDFLFIYTDWRINNYHMELLDFRTWLAESGRAIVKIGDLDLNRRYKGTRYEYELFPRFKRLQVRIKELDKKPDIDTWFTQMQNSDAEFYSMVQTGALGQPDVRDLWRDLTGQRSSRMRKYNLAEGIDDEP